MLSVSASPAYSTTIRRLKNKTCSAHDYEGVWAYISQGGGNNYNSMVRVEYEHMFSL